MSASSTLSSAPASADVRRLYAYHALSSLALAFIGSDFFSTRLILHYVDMAKYGLIAGVGLWVPSVLNLLTAPYIINLGVNRAVVAVGTLGRILVSFLFLLLPMITHDAGALFAGFAVIYVMWMACAFIANNSLAALIRTHVPTESLGRHSAVMLWLWDFPYRVAGIGCAWYIARQGADPHFLRPMFILLIVTGAAQLPATYFILRLTRVERAERAPVLPIASIIEPFRDARFRTVSSAVFAVTALTGMSTFFFYPFIIDGLGWSLTRFAVVGAVMSVMGFAFAPMWGRLADRVGGKNVYFFTVLGMGLALLMLGSERRGLVWVFTLLGWGGSMGLFGAGVAAGQRYLLIATGSEHLSNIYIAAMTFINGCGYLVGSIIGGRMLVWLAGFFPAGDHLSPYRIYFAICALMFLLAAQFVRMLPDDRRRFTPAEMLMEVYGELRGWAGRWE